MSQYLKNRKYNPTTLLQDIMTWLFPSQLAERKHIHDAEMAELSKLVAEERAAPLIHCSRFIYILNSLQLFNDFVLLCFLSCLSFLA